jgi:hypothetical protein
MTIAGLRIRIEKSAVYAFSILTLLVIMAAALIAWATGELHESSFGALALIGLGVASFHFFAQFVHLSGHALAAWATGYPMSGMLFTYVFGMSLYPTNEPKLPDRVHVQRSLGGVVAFGLLFGVVLVFWLSARSAPAWAVRYLAAGILLDAALLFAVSALISDGLLFIVRKEWRDHSSLGTTHL